MTLFEGKDFVTPNDLAEARILSRSKQVDERNRGRLRCLKLGGKVLYTQQHITDYLALCEHGGQERSGNAAI